MKPSIFYGAFTIRNQGHGILSSTYFNNHDKKPYPETAILNSQSGTNANDPFIGMFETSWIEAAGHFTALLEIKQGQSNSTYELIWTDKGTKIYEGWAASEEGILFGCYTNL